MLKLNRFFGRAKKAGPDFKALSSVNKVIQSHESPAVRETRDKLYQEFNQKYGKMTQIDMNLVMREFEKRFDDEVQRNSALKEEVERTRTLMESSTEAKEAMAKSIEMVEQLGVTLERTGKPRKD